MNKDAIYPDPETLGALCDMRDNILLAQKFVIALTFDVFVISRLHCYAVTHAIEIISEASRRLPDELWELHPQLSWHAIHDSGNVSSNKDNNAAESRIWAVLHGRLPRLLDAVTGEIAALEGRELKRQAPSAITNGDA